MIRSDPRTVRAQACANIALIKYWGKRNEMLNLPQTGSLSLTLAELHTTATVCFQDQRSEDKLTINGHPAPVDAQSRLSHWLDIVRTQARIQHGAVVDTESNFPVASGLASSASAFAALTLAATNAAGLDLSDRENSILARQGSGSAARSIFGGFVRMHRGQRTDGQDAFAEPLAVPCAWPIRMVVAVVGEGNAKPIGSRDAMRHSRDTSPLHTAWVDTVQNDLHAAEDAIRNQDFERFGALVEANALAMHATAIAARPGILYWKPATIECIHSLRQLRQQGTPTYLTMDAGPHVKALTLSNDAPAVAKLLRSISGVSHVRVCTPGPAAKLVDSSPQHF